MENKPRASHTRIFTESPLEEHPASYDLSDSESHYLRRVLRLSAGDMVELADGSGRLLVGVISDASVDDLELVYTESFPAPRVLFAALIKGNRWDTLLEKAAEIGVSMIVPIEADRSVVTIKSSKQDAKIDRWQKILDGAARQCERLSRPTIVASCRLEDALNEYSTDRTFLLDETEPGQAWPAWERTESIRLGVGPEGGWTPAERDAWLRHSAESVGLGSNLLRAETAAAAALMLVRAVDYGLIPRS